ncbi:MAG: hypothetical protein ACLVJ6_11380 [Merdibacter sp.]
MDAQDDKLPACAFLATIGASTLMRVTLGFSLSLLRFDTSNSSFQFT